MGAGGCGRQSLCVSTQFLDGMVLEADDVCLHRSWILTSCQPLRVASGV